MRLDGPPLWDFFEVMAYLGSVRPQGGRAAARAAGEKQGPRVAGMLLLLPTVAAKLLALHELATRSDADSERTWVEVRGRLDAEVAACRWPAPRLLADGDAMRLAIEYVAELDPAALRTACDEGPTPAEDWRDALAEVLATAMHLRRVAEQESLPTMGAYRESERRAAGKRAEERRRELARWKSY